MFRSQAGKRSIVLGRPNGSGGGPGLIFTSRLDTFVSTADRWTSVGPTHDVLTKAWRDGEGRVSGLAVVSCCGARGACLCNRGRRRR